MAKNISTLISKLKLSGVQAANRLPPRVRQAINTARGIDTPTLVSCLNGNRVVVLSPHPDDELIGAGGAICAHLAAGHTVNVVQMTSGEATARLSHLAPPERIAHREKEALKAAERIGLSTVNITFARYADGDIDGTNADSNAKHSFRLALKSFDADIIYAPWPIDAHQDHVATTKALGEIIRQGDLPQLTAVALYEVWTPVIPTHLVDITKYLEQKLHALSAYESALSSVDYLHTAKGMAAYRSAQGMHGKGYAEAFCVLNPASFLELLDRAQ